MIGCAIRKYIPNNACIIFIEEMLGTRGVKAALVIYIAAFMIFVGFKVFHGQFFYVTVPVESSSSKFSTTERGESLMHDSEYVVGPRTGIYTKTTEQKLSLTRYQSVMCQKDPQASYPFCNVDLDFASRTDDLVGRLTMAEMIQQTSSIAPAIPRLGINAYNWRSNCMHGWSRSGGKWIDTLQWTVFPAPIALGATFDTDLLYRAGQITSDEGRALHNVMLQEFKGESTEAAGLNCFSPNVNLFRDPRWGRGQETYGEDPYLLSMLGVAYTRGLQEGKDQKYLKVAACAKHYAVHSGPEELRLGFVANVSLYDLYSTYLPAFKSQVLAGKVAQMMPAYSGVRVPDFSEDGAPDCANKYLLKTILREEFSASNISVVSDNGGIEYAVKSQKFFKTAVESAAASVSASTDIDLGFDQIYSSHLQSALNENLVDEQNIKDAVWRSFYLRMRLGDFDPPSKVMYQSIGRDHLDTYSNQAVNLEAAIKSIILLKNKDDFLPLLPTALKKIAVIGPNINAIPLSNYQGIPSTTVSVLQGITATLGNNVVVSSATGCSNSKCIHKTGFGEAKSAAQDAEVVFMVMGADQSVERESRDRTGYPCHSSSRSAIGLPGCQHDLISLIEQVNDKIVLILLNGAPLTIPVEDQSDKIHAIVEAFYPGALGGKAIAKVLFGEVSPAGRTPVTVVQSEDDLPPAVDYNMNTDPGRTYRYLQKPALYPFGYGLSYTLFDYSNLVISPKVISPCDSIVVSVEVQNSGKMDSDEVVQVYLTSPKAPGVKVNAQYDLVSFNRSNIPAGSIVEIKFIINAYVMSSVGLTGRRTIVPGSFYVHVGNASPLKSDKQVTILSGEFTLKGKLTDVSDCPNHVPKCLAC